MLTTRTCISFVMTICVAAVALERAANSVHAGETPAAAAKAKPAQKPLKLTLQIMDWKETLALAAKHKGKVVVIDLWSTNCETCIKEFPHFVALQNKHPRDVVCISYNCNFAGGKGETPESHREEVLAFLRDQKADFIHILSSTADEKLYDQIKLSSIPAVYVFEKSGKLAARIDSNSLPKGDREISYEKHVVPLVERLSRATYPSR